MLVIVEVEDRVATVTLNRPESRNAISAELHAQLDEAVTTLDARDDVGCMVLTGADPAFCAGMDLKSLSNEDRAAQKERQRTPAQRFAMMAPHATPVIGAINGPTVTGGLELAMCCDFLIASERARFADTHVRVGVMPGGGMTIRLPQLVGIDRARRMSLTGDYIDAATARDVGPGGGGRPPRVAADPGPRARGHHRLHPVRVRARAPARLRGDQRPFRERRVGRGEPVVAGVDGGAFRPVAALHRAREDRGGGREQNTERPPS